MKIEEVNLTKDNLIKIEEIDNTFYKNDITGIDWYLQRYNENHKADYFLTMINVWVIVFMFQ